MPRITSLTSRNTNIKEYKYRTTPGSVKFNGKNFIHVQNASSAFNYGTGNFTIEFWVYPLSGPVDTGNPTFYTNCGDDTWNALSKGIRIGHMNAQFGSGTSTLTYSSAVTNNVWTHIAIVRNDTTITAYINGTNRGTLAYSGELGDNTHRPSLATTDSISVQGGGAGKDHLTGYIADLRIVKGVAVYTANFTAPTNSLANIPGTSLLLNTDYFAEGGPGTESVSSGNLNDEYTSIFDISNYKHHISNIYNIETSTLSPYSLNPISVTSSSANVTITAVGVRALYNTGTVQTLNITGNGIITLRAWGGGGGWGYESMGGGGAGAKIMFNASTGDVLTLYIGQGGGSVGSQNGESGGGGGGTFVYLNGTLLLAVGGGGGGAGLGNFTSLPGRSGTGYDRNFETLSANLAFTSIAGGGSRSGGAGGVNGQGGAGSNGGGGGGILSAGTAGTIGGAGQRNNPLGSGGGGSSLGGLGGGGGGGTTGGGGGGGYSGGGGGADSGGGGGGSSYIDRTRAIGYIYPGQGFWAGGTTMLLSNEERSGLEGPGNGSSSYNTSGKNGRVYLHWNHVNNKPYRPPRMNMRVVNKWLMDKNPNTGSSETIEFITRGRTTNFILTDVESDNASSIDNFITGLQGTGSLYSGFAYFSSNIATNPLSINVSIPSNKYTDSSTSASNTASKTKPFTKSYPTTLFTSGASLVINQIGVGGTGGFSSTNNGVIAGNAGTSTIVTFNSKTITASGGSGATTSLDSLVADTFATGGDINIKSGIGSPGYTSSDSGGGGGGGIGNINPFWYSAFPGVQGRQGNTPLDNNTIATNAYPEQAGYLLADLIDRFNTQYGPPQGGSGALFGNAGNATGWGSGGGGGGQNGGKGGNGILGGGGGGAAASSGSNWAGGNGGNGVICVVTQISDASKTVTTNFYTTAQTITLPTNLIGIRIYVIGAGGGGAGIGISQPNASGGGGNSGALAIYSLGTLSRYDEYINLPAASFSVTTTNSPTILFTNTSENTYSKCYWTFGDGSSSTSDSPSHTYISNGNYTVTLTVNNSQGTNSTTNTVSINHPTMSITRSGTGTNARTEEIITFTSSDSTTDLTLPDISGTGAAYLQNFTGSGTTYSAKFNPPGGYGNYSFEILANKYTSSSTSLGNLSSNTLYIQVDDNLPAIGSYYGGGYIGAYISMTQDGVPTHALIVSPKNTQVYQYLSFAATGTNLINGYEQTISMGGGSGNWARNLRAGGYSDWYLPALYEWDAIYYNLKPSTQSNGTGTFTDTGVTQGVNPYAVPKRTTAWTTTTPTQTAVSNFQSPNNSVLEDQSFTVGGTLGADYHVLTFQQANTYFYFHTNGSLGRIATGATVCHRAIRKVALPL